MIDVFKILCVSLSFVFLPPNHPEGHSRQPKSCIVNTWIKKVSPPFEGGVAGTIDYLIFTSLISRPGWLIYSLLLTFIFMKSKNLFNRKGLKS